jgi:hypothetical protein
MTRRPKLSLVPAKENEKKQPEGFNSESSPTSAAAKDKVSNKAKRTTKKSVSSRRKSSANGAVSERLASPTKGPRTTRSTASAETSRKTEHTGSRKSAAAAKIGQPAEQISSADNELPTKEPRPRQVNHPEARGRVSHDERLAADTQSEDVVHPKLENGTERFGDPTEPKPLPTAGLYNPSEQKPSRWLNPGTITRTLLVVGIAALSIYLLKRRLL